MDEPQAKDITLADLEMFLAFSRSEHFGGAATELDVSVATVQRGIRTLERKLGVPLIEHDAIVRAGRRS
jgi:DNA-binding transcriptional LysR family regulator